MYPSSSSSSSQKSMASASTTGGGLTRYVSAPGSFLTTAVDSVIANPNAAAAAAAAGSSTITREFSVALGSSPTHHHPPRPHPPPFMHYFSGDSPSVSSESTRKANNSGSNNSSSNHGGAHGHDQQHHHLHLSKEIGNKGFDVGGGSGSGSGSGLHRSFGLNEMGVGVGVGVSGGGSSSANLVRQRSSPAGFVGHLSGENAFSLARGIGSSSNGGHGVARLKSQLSFTRQDSLSQISEVNEDVVGGVSTTDNGHHGVSHPYAAASFGLDPWENTTSIAFSAPSGKRAKNVEGDIYFGPSDSQFGFPHETSSVEKLLHIPEDSVPCKIRAKRGCATHPRSIAERERRTRISGRLKKLQDLVPNMDKQTSYSDMLDLAVQHIKSLQNQVQKLRHDLDNCTCGCKPST